MNILLVDDEAAIRDALASFLRLKGHRVTTAASCAEGKTLLATEPYDLLVTDWRIGGDLGDALVIASGCPSIVVSGTPEEVGDYGERVTVLAKPVQPAELLRVVEAQAPPASRRPSDGLGGTFERLAGLPCDVRDRLVLALVLAEADPAQAQTTDDGSTITLEAPLVAGDPAISKLEALGGDLRVRPALGGGLRFSLRVWRDGRPDDVDLVVPLGAPWPQGKRIAVDCHGADLALLPRFQEELAAARRRRAKPVTFLNVPSCWRLWIEVSDSADAVPKRREAGPRLPEVLTMLWSQA